MGNGVAPIIKNPFALVMSPLICIYIYIERERDILDLVCMYVYIYTYIHIDIDIYIYTHKYAYITHRNTYIFFGWGESQQTHVSRQCDG